MSAWRSPTRDAGWTPEIASASSTRSSAPSRQGAASDLPPSRVSCAEDGAQGLEVFGAHDGQFDLVLLDLTMPRMDGEHTFAELRQARPDVRVLITSGYDEQESTRRFSGGGIAGFVQKPLRHDELLNAVKRALAGSPAAGTRVEELGK